MLAAFEENWLEAIAAFKEADGNAQSAELQYLIGALISRSNVIQTLCSICKMPLFSTPDFPTRGSRKA
jgi:hypothetical protein